MGTCNLIIIRKKQIVASLASCNIIIDGIDHGVIKNGSKLQCLLSDGNHEITLKWWRKRKSSVFSFFIPSDTDTAHITVNFSKLEEKFILISNDIKIENSSCDLNEQNHIVEQNPLHMQIPPEEKLAQLVIHEPNISLNEGEVCYYRNLAYAMHKQKTKEEFFEGTLYITNIRVVLLAPKYGFDIYISKITQLLFKDYGFQIFSGSKCHSVFTTDEDDAYIQDLIELMNNQGVFKDEKWLKQQQNHLNSYESSITHQLRELKGLLDEDIITEEEFSAKKEQILGL